VQNKHVGSGTTRRFAILSLVKSRFEREATKTLAHGQGFGFSKLQPGVELVPHHHSPFDKKI
jgi:hypothetical protein